MTGNDYLQLRFLKLIARIHNPPQSAKMLHAVQNGRIAVVGPDISGYCPALLATKEGRYNPNSKMAKVMFVITIQPIPTMAILLFILFLVQLDSNTPAVTCPIRKVSCQVSPD